MDEKVKLLRYYDRVQGILNGEFLPPIMVDVDAVCGACNLDCVWCCQRASREAKSPTYMSVETMQRMGLFCKEWGVKSWRIAGDSEPTLNPNLHYLLNSGHANGIDMGLITNGVLLDTVKDLHLLTYLGISLDATDAETWSRLKNSPQRNFHRIIDNIKSIRKALPDLDIAIKFIRWADEDELPHFAKSLGVNYRLINVFPEDMAEHYRFDVCRGTPLYGSFGAGHEFHLCCDKRDGYTLTDDYTRNDWLELPKLWGSQKHKDLVASIDPKGCQFCSKEWLNTVLENIVLDGKYTKELQVNFI